MLQRLIHGWRDASGARRGAAPLVTQVGVIPYALESGVPVYLLVTSRRTGRWIFPKGACRAGEEPAACAAREAMEEAGVEGEVTGGALGAYRDHKHATGAAIRVEMYPLRVTRQHDSWDEKNVRRRHWATLDDLRQLVTTPGLIDLAERADAQIRSQIRAEVRASARRQGVESEI